MTTNGRCAYCFYNGISVAWCPALVIILLPLTILSCYFIAINNGHVLPFWPYISDTGTLWPESALFGQLLNMTAIASAFTFYFWHRYAMRWLEQRSQIIFARVTLTFGLLSAFGLSIVANFQEKNITELHDFGAVLCFGFGSVYSALNANISLRFVRQHIGFAIVRATLATLSIVAFVITVVGEMLAKQKFDGDDRLKWLPNDAGYTEHIMSTIAEWIMALLFGLIFATMIPDLYHYSSTPIALVYRWHDNEAGVRQRSKMSNLDTVKV